MADQSTPDTALARRLHQRILREWRATTLLLLALVFCLSWFADQTGISRLNHYIYDQLVDRAPLTTPSSDIVIVVIDESSIEELGFWPWRRTLHGQLLNQLGAARVVGFDLLFSESNPAYPHDEASLARAMEKHGRVTLPHVVDATGQVATGPVPVLKQAAAELGYINIDADSDGVLRSVMPYHKEQGSLSSMHFAAAMLRAGNNQSAAKRLLEQAPLPLNITWAGPPASFTMVPYHAVLHGHYPTTFFDHKYVLVGAWSAGLGDRFITPTSKGSTAMAGVEVLANVLNASIHDRWIRRPNTLVTALLALLPVFLAAVLCRRLSPQRAFGLCVAIIGGTLALSAGIFLSLLWWWPPAASLVGCALAYPVWSWRSQHAALNHVNAELELLQAEQPADTHRVSTTTKGQTKQSTLAAGIEQLHRTIERTRQARQRREAMLRFLSHDMRAPLNAILAVCHMAREQQQSARQNHEPEAVSTTLPQLERYAGQTLELVDGLVDLGRAEANELSLVSVDLVDQLIQCCDDIWVRAQQKSIRVSYPDNDEPAWVQGDPALLSRVWLNLLDNAVKYSEPQGHIRCRIQADEQSWLVSIEDDGQGMSAKDLERAFEPFTRLHDASADEPVSAGAGLGLAFVHTVVQRHQGQIWAKSQPGQGSTLYVRLAAT